MKKSINKITAVLLSVITVFSVFYALPFSAEAASPLDVPQLHITTADGNGTKLEKEDGYVNAQFSVDNGATEPIIVKVRGNSTAMTSKKSFTFKLEKKKDLFGLGAGKKWVLLANAFDPTLLRSYVAFDFAQELELAYTSNQKIVELWLDGRFRGCYTLMEPVQEGKDRVDINIEGCRDFMVEYERLREDEGTTYFTVDDLRFGISEPDDPDGEQLEYINNTMARLYNVIKSGDREAIEENLDLSSFVKFYVLNEFLKTNDFNFSSVYFYYKDGRLCAGPPWDYDLSMGNVNKDFSSNSKAAFQTDGEFIYDKLFYKYLCANDWFMQELRREYARHADYLSALSADGGMIDTLAEDYADVFSRNYNEAGWSMRYLINVMMVPLPTYEDNLDFFKNWCAERHNWLSEHYDIDSLRYLTGDSNGDGVIDINDVTAIQKILARAAPDNGMVSLRGSVTGEALTINEATAIQRFLTGTSTPYPIGSIGIVP